MSTSIPLSPGEIGEKREIGKKEGKIEIGRREGKERQKEEGEG